MKIPILSTLLVIATLCMGQASSSVDFEDLPVAVSRSLTSYFPGSRMITAEVDGDDEDAEFEILIKYKAIKLEVEISADGTITGVDLEK
jgi:phage terminase large subunit-like protein